MHGHANVVCSGMENGCFIPTEPDALLPHAALAGELRKSTSWSGECKAGRRWKEKCCLNWWLEMEAGCVSLFHVLNEVSLTIFLKVCFGTEEGMSLSLASLL